MTKKLFASLLLLLGMAVSTFAQTDTVKSVMTKKYNPTTNLIVWPDEFHPSTAKWYVYNEIEINVKPETVWNTLIDAQQWHLFYKGVQSPVTYFDTSALALRNNLQFNMHTMGLRLTPVVKEFVPNERLAWEVRRNNLTGYHAWVIVPTANGCRLITAEAQNGFLTTMQKIFQPNKLLKLHDAWLRVMKQHAENK